MSTLDWLVIGAYFLIMVLIGVWSASRIRTVIDFFTADGKIP